jgi:osmotically-inducible protein OsmY
MSYQNRNRGQSSNPYDENYPQNLPENPRYPGAASGEFSQFGGPHPGGYRDWSTGDTGWNQAGGRASSNPSQRGYPQGGNYTGQGYGSPNQGYTRNYGNDYDDRSYQGDQDHDSQRGGYPRQQPSGYPDYSTPQNTGYGGRSPQSRGYQGQRNDYGYGTQDRGNIDSVLDRDWSSYSGNRSESAGSRYGNQYGPGRGYQQQQGTRRQGPKGYQRSDDRIREQMVERFMESDVELQDVECDVKDGIVSLSGTVKSRHCRHELENIADSVWGVKEVNNNIKIKSGHPT